MKPITKLLPTDPDFMYVVELGKKLKHIAPVNSEMMDELNRNETKLEKIITKMENTTSDTSLSETERASKIHDLAIETGDIQSKIKEHKEYVKQVLNNKRKVKSSQTSARNACTYWKKEDPKKYGEWLIVKMVADRLLKELKEQSLKQKARSIDIMNFESNDKDNEVVILSNDEVNKEDDTVMVTTKDGSIVELATVLPPAEKANKPRVNKKLQKESKYRVSSEYPYIPYEEYSHQLKGGKQRKRRSLEGQGFKWENGSVWCSLCNERFRQSRSMDKHSKRKDHCILVERKKNGDKNLNQRTLSSVDDSLAGMTRCNE